jgi:hypothetical protein
VKRFPSKKSIRIAAALAVASGTLGLASIVGLSSSAQADPAWTSSYVGVGADVTQDVFAGLGGTSPAPPSAVTHFFTPLHADAGDGNTTISSFDANPPGGSTTAPGCVTTKLNGPAFDRPNSTTNGIAALVAAVNGTGWQNTSATCTGKAVNVTGQIDFARAARGVKTAGTLLTFIPYARDALGLLVFDHGTNHLSSLTTGQLLSLYSSTTGTITIGGDTVRACLPITGSTPRSNLEAALGGLSDTTAGNAATAANCNQIEQNNGNKFYANAAALTTGTDSVIPISVGSWIGQANGVGLDRSNAARTNNAYLTSITDGTTSIGSPTSGTAPNVTPNTGYYQDTLFGYNVYTVVPTRSVTPGGNFEDTGLESLFAGSGSALCNTANQAIVRQFGFDALTASEGTCGATTLTGNN